MTHNMQNAFINAHVNSILDAIRKEKGSHINAQIEKTGTKYYATFSFLSWKNLGMFVRTEGFSEQDISTLKEIVRRVILHYSIPVDISIV